MGLFAPCEYNRYWRRREKPFGTTMTFAIIPRQCEKSGRAVAVAAARHCDLDRRVGRSSALPMAIVSPSAAVAPTPSNGYIAACLTGPENPSASSHAKPLI